MSKELPPASYSAPDRPPVVERDGWRIYLHIHDAEYMRQRALWKQRLSATHPDHGGSSNAFRAVLQARMKWQYTESIWYARLGLLPPDGAGEQQAGLVQNIRLRAQAHLTRHNKREEK